MFELRPCRMRWSSGAFQPQSGIDVTSIGGPFGLEHPCFAVRNAPRQLAPRDLRGGLAKTALCAAPCVDNGKLALKLTDTPGHRR